jgi:hypothetical protein
MSFILPILALLAALLCEILVDPRSHHLSDELLPGGSLWPQLGGFARDRSLDTIIAATNHFRKYRLRCGDAVPRRPLVAMFHHGSEGPSA